MLPIDMFLSFDVPFKGNNIILFFQSFQPFFSFFLFSSQDTCSVDKYAFEHEGIIRYEHSLPKLEQLTICTWMRFTNHTGDHTLFTYSGEFPQLYTLITSHTYCKWVILYIYKYHHLNISFGSTPSIDPSHSGFTPCKEANGNFITFCFQSMFQRMCVFILIYIRSSRIQCPCIFIIS